jgi:hypothetical protein
MLLKSISAVKLLNTKPYRRAVDPLHDLVFRKTRSFKKEGTPRSS